MPKLLTNRQYKKIDRLFFIGPAIKKELDEVQAERVAAAEKSCDPTARTSIETIGGIPCLGGYENPVAWISALTETWERYNQNTEVGSAMLRRYNLKESAETTCIILAISPATYWNWRNEFLDYAALALVRKGITLEFREPT